MDDIKSGLMAVNISLQSIKKTLFKKQCRANFSFALFWGLFNRNSKKDCEQNDRK